jgi:hypothetical protein
LVKQVVVGTSKTVVAVEGNFTSPIEGKTPHITRLNDKSQWEREEPLKLGVEEVAVKMDP